MPLGSVSRRRFGDGVPGVLGPVLAKTTRLFNDLVILQFRRRVEPGADCQNSHSDSIFSLGRIENQRVVFRHWIVIPQMHN